MLIACMNVSLFPFNTLSNDIDLFETQNCTFCISIFYKSFIILISARPPPSVPPKFIRPVTTTSVTEGEKILLEAQYEGT